MLDDKSLIELVSCPRCKNKFPWMTEQRLAIDKFGVCMNCQWGPDGIDPQPSMKVVEKLADFIELGVKREQLERMTDKRIFDCPGCIGQNMVRKLLCKWCKGSGFLLGRPPWAPHGT